MPNKTTGENPVLPSRARKSEKLTKEERREFKKWVKAQGTQTDAAINSTIPQPTINRILYTGSGNPLTIAKIREVITVISIN